MAAEVTNEANDKQQGVPMARAARANLDAAGIERPKRADGKPAPIPNTADSGYFSEKAVEETEQIGMDPHFAVGRQKHHEPPVPASAPVPSIEADVKERCGTNCGRRVVGLCTRHASTSSSRCLARSSRRGESAGFCYAALKSCRLNGN